MLQVRRDREIHREDGGWFQARWHFSFDRYRDPEQMGVGPLRVFNHDRLAPGAIWPMHPHADNLGNDGILEPGGVQLMTLGSGALHSEQNASKTEPMEFLQLWILPDTADLTPAVQQRQFLKAQRTDTLLQVVGAAGEDLVTVHQDAAVFVAALSAGKEVTHRFGSKRAGYLYLIEGAVALGGDRLSTGDAAKILDQPELPVRAEAASELILVDVPMRFTPVGVWAR